MTKELRDNRVRLSMDVPTGLHLQLKEMALHHNCTISSWVMRAILDKLKQEEQYK